MFLKLPQASLNHTWRALCALILVGGGVGVPTPAAGLQSVKLGWVSSADNTVVGYKIYYGLASARYTGIVDVGNNTEAIIPNLVEGQTYYFIATAYNILGLESLPSNEIAYTVPLPSSAGTLEARQMHTSAGTVLAIASTGTTSSNWVLEASCDLKAWKAVTRGTNLPVNAIVAPSPTPHRFFRLKCNQSGVWLVTREVGSNAFPGSFFITTAGRMYGSWTVETSLDLTNWSALATESNTPVNVAVIPSSARAMFFRLKAD